MPSRSNPAGTPLPTPAAASPLDGPATSSVSASREVAVVSGRVRRVGNSWPPRVNQTWTVTVDRLDGTARADAASDDAGVLAAGVLAADALLPWAAPLGAGPSAPDEPGPHPDTARVSASRTVRCLIEGSFT